MGTEVMAVLNLQKKWLDKNDQVRFQVLMAASMKMAVFWVVVMITLMMEAAGTSEMSVNFYQTTLCSNIEDSHLKMTILYN
jgi:hypothetical protein